MWKLARWMLVELIMNAMQMQTKINTKILTAHCMVEANTVSFGCSFHIYFAFWIAFTVTTRGKLVFAFPTLVNQIMSISAKIISQTMVVLAFVIFFCHPSWNIHCFFINLKKQQNAPSKSWKNLIVLTTVVEPLSPPRQCIHRRILFATE